MVLFKFSDTPLYGTISGYVCQIMGRYVKVRQYPKRFKYAVSTLKSYLLALILHDLQSAQN